MLSLMRGGMRSCWRSPSSNHTAFIINESSNGFATLKCNNTLLRVITEFRESGVSSRNSAATRVQARLWSMHFLNTSSASRQCSVVDRHSPRRYVASLSQVSQCLERPYP